MKKERTMPIPHPPPKRALLWVRRGSTLVAHRDGRRIVVRPNGEVRRTAVNR